MLQREIPEFSDAPEIFNLMLNEMVPLHGCRDEAIYLGCYRVKVSQEHAFNGMLPSWDNWVSSEIYLSWMCELVMFMYVLVLKASILSYPVLTIKISNTKKCFIIQKTVLEAICHLTVT